MQKVNLSIPKKSGDFYISKLGLTETLDFIGKISNATQEDRILMLVQMTLVDSQGKILYKPQQRKKMEKELGGVELLKLSLVAQRLNDFDSFGQLSEKIEEAEKN